MVYYEQNISITMRLCSLRITFNVLLIRRRAFKRHGPRVLTGRHLEAFQQLQPLRAL